MTLALIKYDSNYADEFDLQGFAIYEKEAWNHYMNMVEQNWEKIVANEGQQVYFGTNEAVVYDNFNYFKKSFKIENITPEKSKIICDTFNVSINKHSKSKKGPKLIDNESSYGHFILIPTYKLE